MPKNDTVEAESLGTVATPAPALRSVTAAPAGPQATETKQAGKWADELQTPDGIFNGANLVERWLATPRSTKTRKHDLEQGREMTRTTYEAGIERALAVTCH